MFYKQIPCTSCTCSGENGTTGVKWAHPVQLENAALPEYIDLSTRLKQQKRTDNDFSNFFTIRKFARYVSSAQINQSFVKISLLDIIRMYTTRVYIISESCPRRVA